MAKVDLRHLAASCEGTPQELPVSHAEKLRVQPRSLSALMSLDLLERGRTYKRDKDTATRMSKMKERFLNRFRLKLKEFQRYFHVPPFIDEETENRSSEGQLIPCFMRFLKRLSQK